jgi:hypothetical protein
MTFDTIINLVTSIGVVFVGFILNNLKSDIRDIRKDLMAHMTDHVIHGKGR